MKAVVFTDEAVREQAGRFVWLEVDTDKRQNAAFREKYPVRALPTYLVVEPDREQVILRWVGGATVPQLLGLLDDARENFDRVRSGGALSALDEAAGKGASAPEAARLLAEADLLYGAGRNAEAAVKYQEAIDVAPEGWDDYARAVESRLVNWSLDGEDASAARFAREAHPHLAGTTSGALAAGIGLDSAIRLPDDDESKSELVTYFQDAVRQVVDDRSIPIADDDRSGLYISLVAAREAAGDSGGVRTAVAEWSAFLEDAAARAASPEERTVFDSHRLSAYLELGEPENAVAMLKQSERDFPEDYNPPARLALAYRAMESWEEALAACDRAIDLAYGPRQLRYLGTRASILSAKGDTVAARTTLEDAIRRAEEMPPGQRSQRTIDSLRSRLEALSP